jgi:hypothetical protein
MAIFAEAAVQGVEIESWDKMIYDYIFDPDNETLYAKIKEAAKTNPTANITAAPGNVGGTTGLAQRPAYRVMIRVQSGAAIAQGTGDGDALPRGTGSQWISGNIAPVFTFSGCEISYLAQRATQGPKRSTITVRAEELRNTLSAYMRGLEAQFNGDTSASGAVDQIPTTAVINNGTGTGVQTSSIVGLDNANQVQDQQILQVFPSIGGVSRGSFQVSYADGVTNTIYSSTALPVGTAVGDYLMIAGATGAANTSIATLRTYQQTGNTGTFLGQPRANFPGRMSTPSINLSGAAVNPFVPFRLEILINRGLGTGHVEKENLMWYLPPDQNLAVTALSQNVAIVNQQDVKGDSSLDMTKKHMSRTFGDIEIFVGYNAPPGRGDLLDLKTWGIVEMIEPSIYQFGNSVTSMPVPAPSGSGTYLTSNVFYYHSCINLYNGNPKANAFYSNAAQPAIT